MPIFWRPQFRIGHDDIDADHRYLILLINTVELVLRFPDDPRNVDLALAELRRYAEYHFEREESASRSPTVYLHLDQHKREHRALLAEIDVLARNASMPRSRTRTAAWRASRSRAARSPPSCASGWSIT